MKKGFFAFVFLLMQCLPFAYAESSNQNCSDCVYELHEGTVKSLLIGEQVANMKGTFLLNKETGDVWVYLPEGGAQWKLTEKAS